MPDPNETNRERLLRLIDGGPDVVKEVQEERKPTVEDKKPAVVIPVKQIPAAKSGDLFPSVKEFLSGIRWDAVGIIKITAVVALLVLTLHSAVDLFRSFGKQEKAPVAAAAASGPVDESGAGLRLVGVDWGEPPVALLEDLKTGKTYFAHKNDKIKEARVKEIFKDKVTVVVHGRSLELR